MADPKIDGKIQLTVAMGVSKGMPPEVFIKRWNDWGTKFPEEKATLSPAITIALDTLSTTLTIYNTLINVITIIQNTVVAAGKAYSIVLSLLPGVGAANGAKEAAEAAMTEIKKQIDELVKKIYQLPITIYDSLTNTKVSEDAKL